MKILIADDDRFHRLLLESLLTEWGHSTISVCDGETALQTLQEQDPPRLAILDWDMPQLSGPEICEKVRKQQSTEPIWLILLTARYREEDRMVGLSSGADDYLTKPFDSEVLRARLEVGLRTVVPKGDSRTGEFGYTHEKRNSCQ